MASRGQLLRNAERNVQVTRLGKDHEQHARGHEINRVVHRRITSTLVGRGSCEPARFDKMTSWTSA